jgi:hypothetical protein
MPRFFARSLCVCHLQVVDDDAALDPVARLVPIGQVGPEGERGDVIEHRCGFKIVVVSRDAGVEMNDEGLIESRSLVDDQVLHQCRFTDIRGAQE